MSTAGSHNVQLQSETTNGEGMEAIPPNSSEKGKESVCPEVDKWIWGVWRFRNLPKNA